MSKSAEAPASLVKYEPAVKIYQSMRSYHQRPEHEEASSDMPPKVEDVLNSIIPPRDWHDHMDKLYIQYVSHQPASRQDVIELQNRLNKILEDRQARKFGVCPIREELYSQVFDQLIRQVAVDCPERGLLLMRVRDEHKMTLAAYHTIYQSSVDFGMRKQVQSEQGVEELEQELQRLAKQKLELSDKRDSLIFRKQMKERQIRERTTAAFTKRQEELKFLQMQTENLNKFLSLVKEQLY